MAKIPVPLPDGRVVEGVEVGVEETTERWSEVKLADGTKLRVKMAVVGAVRTDAYDPAGNPTYSLNMAPVIAVVEVPGHLKKGRN
jgi:hypothetical protein